MAEYNAPGVYLESVNNTSRSVQGRATDVFGFVGVTPRGTTEPTLVTSWNNFIEEFAGGLASPFLADFDLSYAVYGFFQNGGTRAVIARVTTSETKTAATPAENATFKMSAKDGGAWGNNLKVSIKKNAINEDTFDVIVKLGTTIVESFANVTNNKDDYLYVFDVINAQSNYITLTDETACTLAVTETDFTFEGGADGMLNPKTNATIVKDNDYCDAIDRMGEVDDISFLSVPGISTDAVIQKLKDFVDGAYYFTVGIVDVPKGCNTKAMALEFRKKIQSDSLCVVEPWGYVTDPLSPSGRLRLVPPSGHWCGYEAENIHTNGIQKAPAGTEATITGFVSLEKNYTAEDLEMLNPAGIITLINKKNYGIVIWGCRSCSSDPNYRYITDKIVDNYIDGSIYTGTQWAVFEDNDPDLWDDLSTSVTEFLENCRTSGIIKGTTPQTSYYVNCNEDINTDAVQKSGKVICEYGFAKKKPAEFVIHRVNHNMATATTAEEA